MTAHSVFDTFPQIFSGSKGVFREDLFSEPFGSTPSSEELSLYENRRMVAAGNKPGPPNEAEDSLFDHLFPDDSVAARLVIVSGLAGTGKTTFLHFFF